MNSNILYLFKTLITTVTVTDITSGLKVQHW